MNGDYNVMIKGATPIEPTSKWQLAAYEQDDRAKGGYHSVYYVYDIEGFFNEHRDDIDNWILDNAKYFNDDLKYEVINSVDESAIYDIVMEELWSLWHERYTYEEKIDALNDFNILYVDDASEKVLKINKDNINNGHYYDEWVKNIFKESTSSKDVYITFFGETEYNDLVINEELFDVRAIFYYLLDHSEYHSEIVSIITDADRVIDDLVNNTYILQYYLED